MNPETLRCRILDYTKREMYQHGADGLTMDDIARGMKMSKRTLYKLFPSKTSLFRVCLSDFANGIRSRIQQNRYGWTARAWRHFSSQWMAISPLLHSLGKKLLMDIAADREYRAAFEREEAFWLQQLIDVLTHCKICGYLLPGVDPDRFAPDLQEVIYQSSLQGTPYLVQRMLNYTLLRGLLRWTVSVILTNTKPDNLNVCV